MKNLNLTNLLTANEIKTLCFNVVDQLSEEDNKILKDKIKYLANIYEEEIDEENKDMVKFLEENINILYELSEIIDIENPYECYNHIKRIASMISPIQSTKEYRARKDLYHLAHVLDIQFGPNWINRLVEEKYTVEKLLAKHLFVSTHSKKQLDELYFEIEFECYEAQRDGESSDSEYVLGLEYNLTALGNYIKCNFK